MPTRTQRRLVIALALFSDALLTATATRAAHVLGAGTVATFACGVAVLLAGLAPWMLEHRRSAAQLRPA